MADFVTLEELRDHLHILLDEGGHDLERKLDAAEDIVLDYVERTETGWTAETIPLQIKAAIMMVAAHLQENTGEDGTSDPISPAVRSLLNRLRDPVLA